MTDEAILKSLPKDSILHSLGKEAVLGLLQRAAKKAYAKGRMLYEQGAEGDSMTVVLSGMFKIYTVNARGREVVFTYVGSGGVIGEMSLFDAGPRSANVEASEAAEVLVLQARDVRAIIQKDGAAALRLIAELSKRLRRTNALLEDGAASALAPRLARAILRAADELGPLKTGPITLKLRQSDLAAYAGLSRENVNRQLQEWADEGLVTPGRGKLDLNNRKRMEEVAEDEED
jgi:CRP-like cAMP-binding protein